MDVVYTLIGFTLGLVIAAVIVMIGQGIVNISGMFFYPLLYNTYQSVSSQVPSNSSVQTTLSNSFQNSINYISQANTFAAMAINTLGMVLEIIAVIGAFIIILQLLMGLAMPRTTVVAPAGY